MTVGTGEPVNLKRDSTDSRLSATREVAPVVQLPVDYEFNDKFELLQQWEGVVQTVAGDTFMVALRDLTNPSHVNEDAEIDIQEISPDDITLLQPGAVLYWSIGYETTHSGQRKRVSAIRLRRMPVWSKRDVNDVKRRAAELWQVFGVDDQQQSSLAR